MTTRKIASIDIGTNTIRLVIYEIDANPAPRFIEEDWAMVRLGEGMDQEKKLLPHRIDIALGVLERFRNRCDEAGVTAIYPVATSAVREARNKEEFLKQVFDRTGMRIEVIPWEEEARLTLRGVFWKIPDPGDFTLTFDIGGGSTEFILSRGQEMVDCVGTSLGTVRLTEKFITRHPVVPEEQDRLQDHLTRELEKVRSQFSGRKVRQMIGTAGTVTTLAALDQNVVPYAPERIHGSILVKDRIVALQEMLMKKTLQERLQLEALERGREDVIIAGVALVLTTLDVFECQQLTVSEYGIREGILLKAMS